MSVKIASLELENVKRIHAVELEPAQDGLTVIGGKNAQGKTSVLDALAWALGGDKMKPADPNRKGGATPARLRVELSNGIVVERKGKNGSLHVTDTTGKKAGQQLLNEFISQLSLNIPRFMNGSDTDKATALLQTLGIDAELAKIDGSIRATFQDRQLVGRDAKAKRAHAEKLPHYDDAPAKPVSAAKLIQEQQVILARNGEKLKAKQDAEDTAKKAEFARTAVSASNMRVADLEQQLTEARAELARRTKEAEEAEEKAKVLAQSTAELVLESTEEIETSIANIETINNKVRDNQAKAEADAEALRVEQEYDGLTQKLEDLRAKRRGLLDGAPLPLPELSIDDEGALTYKDHTWGDMSGAEQLVVATAIVRATKPECGFVLVDKLEQFDTDELKKFGEWAKGEGLQIIGTRVATDDSCTVVIVDGRIEGQDLAEPAPEKSHALDWDGDTAQPTTTTQPTTQQWKGL